MGRRHQPPPELRTGAFAGRDVRDLVTRRQLSSAAYERLCRGAYRAADPDGDPATYAVRVRGFLAVLPARTVLVGRTAAWAGGVWSPWPDDPVEVNTTPFGSVRPRAGLHLSARTYPEHDVGGTRRGTATTPARTALDLACLFPAETAVPVLDAILARTGLRVEDLLARLDAEPPGRGTRRARSTLALTDPRAESPRESLLRLLVRGAGLPAPVVQHVVHLPHGRARLDLAWPDLRVALEYDGWPHDDPARRSADLARHNALRAAGWVVIQVDAQGLRRPEVFLAQLATALGR